MRTGAAAPEAETKNLMDIVGNIDSMGRRQLLSAMASFRESLKRQRDTQAAAIASGMPLQSPSEKPRVNLEHPVNKLIASGMTPDEALARIRRYDGRLKAFVRVFEPPLMGEDSDGPTFAVKDLFAIKGYRIGAGNPAYLESVKPETSMAAAVADLLR